MGMAISTKDGNCSIRETIKTDNQPGGIKRYPIFRQSHGRFTCFYRPPATEIVRNEWNRVVLRFFLVISVSQHLKVPGRWGNMAVALRTVRPWGVGTGDLRTMAKGLRSWCIQPKLWRHPGTSSLRRKSLTDWHPVHSPAVETIALEALFAKSLVDFRGEFWPLAFTNSLFLESLPALGFWALKSTWLVDFPFTQRSDRSQSDQMHRAVAIYHPKSWTQLDLTDSNAIPPVMSSSAIWGPV